MRKPAGQPGVLFLHHFGGSARTWNDVMARLDGVETRAIDLAGFGAAADATGPFDVARYARDAEAALDTMAGDRIIVVGHSMGGKLALALAARQPPAIAALVLLSPSPPTPEPMTAADRAEALAGWGLLDHAEATLAQTTARPLGSHVRHLALDDMLRSGAAAWRAWLEGGSLEDIAPRMGDVAVPVTVLCGSDDATIPADVHRRELMPWLRDATLAIVPGAGHLLPLEAPDTVAQAIIAQLALAERGVAVPASS